MHRKSKAPRRGASIGWQAMSVTVKCDDCDVDVIRAGEFYMVKPGLWSRKLGLKWEDNLCVGCLESRLGRKLTNLDFLTFPPNPGGFATSERLLPRILGEHYDRTMKRTTKRTAKRTTR
jgi:hypothetical protein